MPAKPQQRCKHHKARAVKARGVCRQCYDQAMKWIKDGDSDLRLVMIGFWDANRKPIGPTAEIDAIRDRLTEQAKDSRK